MIHIGKVRRSATVVNAHAARNFPRTRSDTPKGSVIESSIVPVRRSSAQSRIDTAGTRKT